MFEQRSSSQPNHNGATYAARDRVARLCILAISTLIALKVMASVLTGSVGILADLMHSLIDLSGAIIGFISIRISRKPPDKHHAFGHGKAEGVAAVIIAALIFLAGGIIIYEAIDRILSDGEVEMVGLGIGVTAGAVIINAVVSLYALKISRREESIALEATARDLAADMLSSVAVLIGLSLVWATGVTLLDPIVALLVALLIIRTAYITMHKAVSGLMDTSLPETEESAVRSCISRYSDRSFGFENLVTRRSGNERHIEFQLIMPANSSVEEAHRVCDQIEHDIEVALGTTRVTIHIEPCPNSCYQCKLVCNSRQA